MVLDEDKEYAPSLVALVGTIDEEGQITAQNEPVLAFRRHYIKKQLTADPVDVVAVTTALGVDFSELYKYEVRVYASLGFEGDGVDTDSQTVRLKSDATYAQRAVVLKSNQSQAEYPVKLFPCQPTLTNGYDLIQIDSVEWAHTETFWHHVVVEIYLLPGAVSDVVNDTP